MRYAINPIKLSYPYNFVKDAQRPEKGFVPYREGADPSLVHFKDRYYLFLSMNGGFYSSRNLVDWDFHPYLGPIPIADYAPDVCVIGDYLYLTASHRNHPCHFYRSQDPIHQAFEQIEGTFDFWDPNLFEDEDGRLYFYWGCTNFEPIWGLELDPKTLRPMSEPQALIDSDIENRGYERIGDNHKDPYSPEERQARAHHLMEGILAQNSNMPTEAVEEMKKTIERYMSNRPYIEGAWMTKHKGMYYLQYAIPGTQYNIYGDGVFVSQSPLGPFRLAENNPYSYKPTGYMNGAGHGSTLIEGEAGWHVSTNAISINADFERRVSLWKAGFHPDGDLYCDQRFGDWPINLDSPAFSDPEWFLLSYRKPVQVSSGQGGDNITDESVKTGWYADESDAAPYAIVDLGQMQKIHAIQVNFSDAKLQVKPNPAWPLYASGHSSRYLDLEKKITRWKLEGSLDGVDYELIKDNSEDQTDYPHDFVISQQGWSYRYIRWTILEVPYQAQVGVSALRVFGKGQGPLPSQVKDLRASFPSSLDVKLQWQGEGAIGYSINWGYAPDKLYHNHLVYAAQEAEIGALVSGQALYVSIDAFNENGLTKGAIEQLR